jgi:anti-sigma factor RsiW
MNCRKAMDAVYEEWGTESLPLFTRLAVSFHLFHCSRCAAGAADLKRARSLLRDSLPVPAEGLEDRIMRSIEAEEQNEEAPEVAGVSFRSWVITGLIVLLSLSSSFFWEGAYLLPIGITVGAIVTAYGAIFIGSHLKELTGRFNLH